MSSIVTGDAVVLDLRPARVPTRMMATLIDAVWQLLAIWLYFSVLQWLSEQGVRDSAVFIGALWAGIITILVVVPLVIETLTRGRGIGKWAIGLRVVRDDGGAIGFRHALVRTLGYWLVDFSLYTVFAAGLVVATLQPEGKRIGDVLAGTMVVRTRSARATRPVPAASPAWDGWARQLEISRVNDDLIAAARYVLARGHLMRPEYQRSMTTYLASEIAKVTAPAPPPLMGPEDFLITVLAEQRRRSRERAISSMAGGVAVPAGWR